MENTKGTDDSAKQCISQSQSFSQSIRLVPGSDTIGSHNNVKPDPYKQTNSDGNTGPKESPKT